MKIKIAKIIFRIIPLSVRKIIVVILARLLYYLLLKHKLISLHNLARAFPDKTPAEIISIAKKSYVSFAIMIAEFPDIIYLNMNNLKRWVSIDGLENYTAARREGKGVLLFGAHFGNWEMGNAALAITTSPFVFVYRILDSPFMEEGITYVRSSYGNVSLSKENTMRKMIRLLKQGATISVLIDQNVAWYEGVFVNFFGREAATTAGLALLALHTESAVLPAFTRRLPNGKYLLEIGKKVEIKSSGNRDVDVLINTQNFTRIVEDRIREYPEQWLWIHQRWKTKRCQEKRRINAVVAAR